MTYTQKNWATHSINCIYLNLVSVQRSFDCLLLSSYYFYPTGRGEIFEENAAHNPLRVRIKLILQIAPLEILWLTPSFFGATELIMPDEPRAGAKLHTQF